MATLLPQPSALQGLPLEPVVTEPVTTESVVTEPVITEPEREEADNPIASLELKNLLDTRVRGRIDAANSVRNQFLQPETAPTTAKRPIGRVSRERSLQLALSAEDLVVKEAIFEEITIGRSANPEASGQDAVTPLALPANRSLQPLLNEILGTSGDDDITGTLEADAINGLQGDDLMRGDNGDDIIVGAWGDDVISGDHVPSRTTQSNDVLFGNSGEDKLFGRLGNDRLYAGADNDQLFGGSGADGLYGGAGDDQLFSGIVAGDQSFNPDPDGRDFLVGGIGNDFLEGGAEVDTLLGTDSRVLGIGEIDIMVGGSGGDIFELGNRDAVYYAGGNAAAPDFGVITDFEAGDRVRLNGDASQYVLGYDSEANSTAIGYTGDGGFELIGVFADQDLSNLSLTSSAFQYFS